MWLLMELNSPDCFTDEVNAGISYKSRCIFKMGLPETAAGAAGSGCTADGCEHPEHGKAPRHMHSPDYRDTETG